jgi:DNA-binding HxlR family transcriptional regulator
MTDCGLDTVLALIGGKWKMLILYHVCHAPRRFGELRRLLSGISEKIDTRPPANAGERLIGAE